MKLAIIGTRPQLLKISRDWCDYIINTGQHYDVNLNDIHDIGCDETLNVKNLGEMIDALITRIKSLKPKQIIVIGDTRSTLAGAVAAKFCGIELVHLEAGMRSYEPDLIEERVRVMTDKLSDIYLCTDYDTEKNLLREGFKNIHIVGDVMYDEFCKLIDGMKINTEGPILITLHRAELVENKERFETVLKAIGDSKRNFLWPIHPRALESVKKFSLKIPSNTQILDPLSRKDLLGNMAKAPKVITDSGGVQREAYWMGKPVIIPRETVEHNHIIDCNHGVLTGYSYYKLQKAIETFEVSDFIKQPRTNVNENIKKILG